MNWWQRLLRRKKMEDQLEKELRFHLEQHASELIAQGLSPDEARRQARLALGGPEQVKENCRDARGTRWMEDLLQDFRYALRMLRKQPGFAAVALLTLALGSGATTVMFTVVNGVLLKPFHYGDPGGLVRLQEQTDWSTPQGNLWAFTYPNYLDCKRESRSLDMAAWSISRGTVSVPGPAEYIDGLEMSSELFSLLGVNVAPGRMFLPEEDRPGAPPVVILSHSFWQRHFAANPAAIGMRLVFDGKPYTIVGITPAGFRLDDNELDVFTPLGQNTSPRMQSRRAHRFGVWARLHSGTTLGQAQAELALVGRRLAQQFPDSNKGRTFIAEPLRPDVGDTRSTLWLLLGAVSLVLLIACANVASLLLARAVSRERELAIRVALGAGRGRLARQCLTESAVLGLSGGLLGVWIAAIGIRPFVAFWPGTLPRAEEVQLDWHVLLFALVISLWSSLLFGLAPALRTPVRELEQTLRAGARTVAGDRARRVPGVQAIAMLDTVPMREGNNTIGYDLTAAAAPEDKRPFVLANSVTPDYLEVAGIPLRRGRFINDQDRKGREPVAVIDDVMAQQAFPGQDPIGKHVWIGIGPDPVTVVGIVGHVRQWGLAADDQAQVRAQLYYPFAQVPDELLRRWSELMSIALRTGIDPLSVVEPLRREVRGVSDDQVLYEVHTMEQLAKDTIATQRFLLLLFAIFAGLALLLACIGIYGVLAYLTGQRVSEIGVRMALGATAGQVTRMVLRQSLGMIFVGVGVGILAALAAGRVLMHTVDGMQSNEPSTFIIMIPVLVFAALLASFGPARRASRIDPIRALRQD